MAFLTLSECKTILQISNTDYDTFISAVLPMIQDDVETWCNISEFPEGLKPICAMMVNYLLDKNITGKQSESIGTYSYTMGLATNGYPDVIYNGLRKYKLTRFGRGTVNTEWIPS